MDLWMACLAALWNPGAAVFGATVSEPDTVLYGRIAQVHGGREFWVTNGEVVLTLRMTLPTVRELRLTARLKAQADGRSSYVIRIPHHLLARGLSVTADRVPLLASGEHPIALSSVTLDGAALQVAPTVTTDLRLASRQRTRAFRVDLLRTGPSADSDGDGAPDAWEENHGRDPWDPRDAVADPGGSPGSGSESDRDPADAGAQATTFAAWRTAWFPDDARPPGVTAGEDPDGDGLPNVVEYAFQLDPLHPDSGVGPAGPSLAASATGWTLRMSVRPAATDLTFEAETAVHLGEWAPLPGAWTASGEGQALVLPDDASDAASHRFYRVRVQLR